MILAKGYEKDGVWIPEITDDPEENMRLVVRALVETGASVPEDERIDVIEDGGRPEALLNEVRLALDLGQITPEMYGRLEDLLDSANL